MTDAVQTLGTTGPVPPQRVVGAVESARASRFVPQEGGNASPSASLNPISPSIKTDPVAGVLITEFRDQKGQVQTQIPSAAAVAYLRVGLTAAGGKPDQAEEAAKETLLA